MLHGWVCSAQRGLGRKVRENLGLAEVPVLPATASRSIRNYSQGSAQLGLPREGSWKGCPACPSILGPCALLQLCNAAISKGWVRVCKVKPDCRAQRFLGTRYNLAFSPELCPFSILNTAE